MDPDQALDNARRALSAYLAAENMPEDDLHEKLARLIETSRELADAFEALDGWLSKGGLVPAAWSKR